MYGMYGLYEIYGSKSRRVACVVGGFLVILLTTVTSLEIVPFRWHTNEVPDLGEHPSSPD